MQSAQSGEIILVMCFLANMNLLNAVPMRLYVIRLYLLKLFTSQITAVRCRVSMNGLYFMLIIESGTSNFFTGL